jgi:hypothetical protein
MSNPMPEPALAGEWTPEPVLTGPRATEPVLAGPRTPEPVLAGPRTPEPVIAGGRMPEWETYRVRRAESEFAAVRKDTRTAYLIWSVTGLLGGHRFYLGDTARSIAMLFTLGGLGVWTIADVFLIKRRVQTVNDTRRADIMARHGVVDGS